MTSSGDQKTAQSDWRDWRNAPVILSAKPTNPNDKQTKQNNDNENNSRDLAFNKQKTTSIQTNNQTQNSFVGFISLFFFVNGFVEHTIHLFFAQIRNSLV